MELYFRHHYYLLAFINNLCNCKLNYIFDFENFEVYYTKLNFYYKLYRDHDIQGTKCKGCNTRISKDFDTPSRQPKKIALCTW